MFKIIVLISIRFYQKYLSPIKGYSCAYAIHTGSKSCSGFGYQAIEKHGVLTGYKLLQKRFQKCSKAAKNPSMRNGGGKMVYDCCGVPFCVGEDTTGGRGCG